MIKEEPQFFGNSLDDYIRMFNLTESDLSDKILDCPGGYSHFAAKVFEKNKDVVAIDPLYQLKPLELEQRMLQTQMRTLQYWQSHTEQFVWQEKPVEKAQKSVTVAKEFLADFEKGVQQKRYLPESLPHLNFKDGAFDLVLSSHFLFTHSDTLDTDFHIKAIFEMIRVASDVRIFPLTEKTGVLSRHLAPVLLNIQMAGLSQEVTKVDYQFQKHGDAMLHIWRETCEVS